METPGSLRLGPLAEGMLGVRTQDGTQSSSVVDRIWAATG